MDEETAAAEDNINGFIAQWEHQRMLQDPAARTEIYEGIIMPLLHIELKRCVKDEVAVPGSASLIVRTVSVDVKQH